MRVSILFLHIFARAAMAADAELPRPNPAPVVAHEWGTFTSLAGLDGAPVAWYRQRVDDLPCFVYRLGQAGKSGFLATVRMETPVVYFYTQEPATVTVKVGFPQGLITEWYPKAKVTPGVTASREVEGRTSEAVWERVEILPGKDLPYPRENRENHYYAARQTDAAPLRVGGEVEKLLFYRGAGTFAIPIRATIEDRGVVVQGEVSGNAAILFENHGGKMGFRSIAPDGKTTVWPALESDRASAADAVERLLVEAGLYRREARAMVETWKDAWFEEGARILYLVPRAHVDRVLPLAIAPAPVELERVFVGRLELLPSWVGQTARAALANDDVETLKRWDRFWDPIQSRFAAQLRGVALGPRVNAYWRTGPVGCVK